KDIIEEAKLIGAKGAGITGGDPLVKIDRVLKYVKLLKKTFGKKFHIHLYTSLDLVTKKNIEKLYIAGIDEIRIHPDIYNPSLWGKVSFFEEYSWDLGVEIPVIPNAKKQTEKLIEFFAGRINFLNLNELEIADSKFQRLGSFMPKDNISYGVKGSETLAKYLLKKYEKKIKNIHYCTTKLKNKAQLGNRLKRRARNIKQPYDYVRKDGMLIRGAIYSANFKKLTKTKDMLIEKYSVPEQLIKIDKTKKRLLTSIDIVYSLRFLLKKENLKPAIVTEYPTWDNFPLEIDFI
ncbi:MAG: radical SAM protein, partial [Candidatus Woesearchaeota archaeon]